MNIIATIKSTHNQSKKRDGANEIELEMHITSDPANSPAKAVSVLRGKDIEEELRDLHGLENEYLVCFTLDAAMMVINRRTVAIGTQDRVYTDPRTVYFGAVGDRAAYVVIAHNHPSGTLEPSKGDINTTQQLVSAGQILGIPLLDHVIITKKGSFSFAANGLMI